MHNRLLRSQLVLLICFIAIPAMAVGPFYSPRLVGMSQWVEHNLAVATNAADARDRLGITTGGGSGETNRNLSSDTGSGNTLVATPDHSGTTNLLRSLTFIGFVSVSTNGSNITVTITQSGETNTASSLGSGTSIIAGKSGTVLQFNSITGAGGTTVLSNANTLTISNNASGGAGDFLADGSVPMTGNLNFGGLNGTNIASLVSMDGLSFVSLTNGAVVVNTPNGLGIGESPTRALLDVYATSMAVPPVLLMTYNGGDSGDVHAGFEFDNESGATGSGFATARGYTPSGLYTFGQLAFSSYQEGGILFDARADQSGTGFAGPIVFGFDSTESARITPVQPLGFSQLFVGLETDDSSEQIIEVSNGGISIDFANMAGGSYWAQGQKGGTGFSVLDADGVTTHAVVGGVVVP